jgi:hypothetical protein
VEICRSAADLRQKKSIHPARFAGHEAIKWVRMWLALAATEWNCLGACGRRHLPTHGSSRLKHSGPVTASNPPLVVSLVSLSLCV